MSNDNSALPLCKCGNTIKFAHETRCEDCWSLDQERWSGQSQRVKLLPDAETEFARFGKKIDDALRGL